MPKLYSGTEVVKRLKRLGFVTISQKGSHLKLRSLGTRNIRTVIVPCTSKLPRDSQVNSPTSQNHQRSSRLGKVIVLKQRPTVSLVKGRSGYCREGLKPHPWQLACVCVKMQSLTVKTKIMSTPAKVTSKSHTIICGWSEILPYGDQRSSLRSGWHRWVIQHPRFLEFYFENALCYN